MKFKSSFYGLTTKSLKVSLETTEVKHLHPATTYIQLSKLISYKETKIINILRIKIKDRVRSKKY